MIQDDDLLKRLDVTPTPLSLLRRTVARQPEHPAIIFLASPDDPAPRVVTYQALLAETESAYRALSAATINGDDTVALLLPAIPEGVSALLAATEAGVAFPLNPLLSANALAAQLRLVRVKVALVLGQHPSCDVWQRLKAAVQNVPSLSTIVEVPIGSHPTDAFSWQAFLDTSVTHSGATAARSPDSVAAIFHSGGTTGAPKLAQLSARNLAAGALMSAEAIGWRNNDRLLMGLPLFHVAGAIDSALASIAAGATLMLPTLLGARHPGFIPNLWSIIERMEATILGLVPTSLIAAMEVPIGATQLRSLRAIVTGSSPFPQESVARIERLTGKPVCQVYGMTETAGIIAAQPADGTFRQHAVGLPARGMHVRIGDGSTLHPAGGEVYVKGPNVFRGYRIGPATSAPATDEWLATGDLGEIGPDGQLHLRGRSKDVIIRSGHNIDPLMIEDTALTHEAVLLAAAVGMPDQYAGELPVLYVTLRPNANASAEAIQKYVADRVADVTGRPKHVFIVAELPLTLIGKIARFKLRQAAIEYAVSAVLCGLPVRSVMCLDAFTKKIQVEWQADATASDRGAATERLGRLGLITSE